MSVDHESYLEVYNAIAAMYDENRLGRPRKDYSPLIDTVLSISGASALGKTTFSRGLKDFFLARGRSVTHIQLDGYLKSREERKIIQNSHYPEKKLSGNDPKSANLKKLIGDMHDLINEGQSIRVPVYDHSTGRTDDSVTAEPAKIVILDGILSLHREIRERFPNFSIFLYSDEATMKGLRLEVDVAERGYSIFEAIAHSKEEFDSYNKWIHHQIELADLKLFVDRERKIKIVE